VAECTSKRGWVSIAVIENGRSRVFLGVHWVFDAFAVNSNGDPDFTENVGGVRLGLTIAEDIFGSGMQKPNPPV
jgi:hypothetical protein